jgi:hypothetical protein
VSTAEKVNSVNDILVYAKTGKKIGLVVIYKGVDSCLEARCEHFGDRLHDTISEGDRSNLGGVKGGVDFWEEDQEHTVDTDEVSSPVVES